MEGKQTGLEVCRLREVDVGAGIVTGRWQLSPGLLCSGCGGTLPFTLVYRQRQSEHECRHQHVRSLRLRHISISVSPMAFKLRYGDLGTVSDVPTFSECKLNNKVTAGLHV